MENRIFSSLFFAALAFVALAMFATAQGPTNVLLECQTSTASLVTVFNARFIENGTYSCNPLGASAVVPNGTLVSVSETGCAGGSHSFSLATGSIGTYTVTVAGGNATTSCAITRLPPNNPTFRTPELPAPLALLLSLLALGIAHRAGRLKR